jgi:hypothetical protein
VQSWVEEKGFTPRVIIGEEGTGRPSLKESDPTMWKKIQNMWKQYARRAAAGAGIGNDCYVLTSSRRYVSMKIHEKLGVSPTTARLYMPDNIYMPRRGA